MLQVCHYMHIKGVAHRDLKPENIMLDSDFNVRFADFGFAAPI
jgi:serine/threonine protein kinase